MRRGEPRMVTALAPYTGRLRRLSELPTQWALPQAAHLLSRLTQDPDFIQREVLPLLGEASDAEEWCVGRRHDGEDGAYSLQIFVWPPGTGTRIHDHSSWGVYRCVVGSVLEERYERLDDGTREGHARLRMAWQLTWGPEDGASTVLPGDGGIHRVTNPGDEVALSVHLYGPRTGEVDGRDYDPSRDQVCDRRDGDLDQEYPQVKRWGRYGSPSRGPAMFALAQRSAARKEDTVESRPDLAIDATGLVKNFGETRAVDGVDLAVRKGTVYGLLGPNGAGKTTTIRTLATLLRPDAGTARVFGHDVVREADAVRSRVSLTGQFASVDEDLTGMENLVLIARLLGHSRKGAKERAGELLEAFGLAEAADRQVKKYSGGMRRRLDIAASIVVTPDLIFLDEPTTGLDPRSRNQVWEIVRALVAGGTTVLLTTQYLDEADRLADRIAVIDDGRVIAEGTSGELKASVGSGALHVRLRDPEDRLGAERVLSRALGVPVLFGSDPAALSARISDPERVAHALAELSRSGVALTDFSLGQPSLDEVFLALTGHPAEDDDANEEDAA
jgi:ABC-2 type transport system ATP-binding protein